MDVNGEPKPATRCPGLREQVSNDGPIEQPQLSHPGSTFEDAKMSTESTNGSRCTNQCNYSLSRHNSRKSVQFSAIRLISHRFSMFMFFFLLFFLLVRTGSAAALKSTCKKVGYKSLIDETGCELMAVFVHRCSGFCLSLSFANPLRGNQLSVYGKCCRMLDVEMIDVTVNCGSFNKTVQVPSAKECGCFDCA
ncbi:unnamed protein product [Bursaphelenchus xylophilus]|uniref:(pine wood nematode) hypothetical protein n=1 Tax=Bursaphelenchus xylophilus TaxID=6326 RepID=A0A1I7RSI0_BURXY|nr:unnamed protein product [Bursaphelenchus xylophilus]CAG9122930.1 unnamed protein product [Bursaphelenchus xylophilus]